MVDGRAAHREFDFRAWRSRMGWTQAQAAANLGLSVRGYQIYEHGHFGQMPRRVPKPVIAFAKSMEAHNEG